MKKEIKEKIVKCFKDYLEDKLISIVLFGSQARGDAKKSSDYDLLIIAEELPKGTIERTR